MQRKLKKIKEKHNHLLLWTVYAIFVSHASHGSYDRELFWQNLKTTFSDSVINI